MRAFIKNLLALFGGLCFFFIASFSLFILALVFLVTQSGSSDVSLSGLTSSPNAVQVVELEGEILMPDKFLAALKKAAESDNVKAIVVRIDSPGGAVGASEEIFREIKRYSQKKPIVCALGSMAASGGLYASMGCSKVVTGEGTITGSIGVILVLPNFKTVTDKIGVEFNVIKTGKYKDSGFPFRSFDEDDRGLLQSVANKAYEQFVKVISDSRKIPVETVKTFADGRIILGEDSVKLGLADEIGGMYRAAKLALELSGEATAEPEILLPQKKTGFMAMFDDLAQSKLYSYFLASENISLRYQLLP